MRNMAAGLVIGYGGGYCIGLAVGRSSAKRQIQKQLEQARANGQITIKNSSGNDLFIEQPLELLNKK